MLMKDEKGLDALTCIANDERSCRLEFCSVLKILDVKIVMIKI